MHNLCKIYSKEVKSQRIRLKRSVIQSKTSGRGDLTSGDLIGSRNYLIISLSKTLYFMKVSTRFAV